jgi:8-oxo-dGTP pyrophosphatase MutT (NUDIX family)
MLKPYAPTRKYEERFAIEEPSWALAETPALVHSAAMGIGKLQIVSSQGLIRRPRQEYLPPARAGKHGREQVAAVCYRLRDSEIEFLLVRTRRGRWTFPKGSIVSRLTKAESAALEAFEEAGVHGRIEEAAFSRYVVRKRRKSEVSEVEIQAYLCEVTRLVTPQESGRNPTWFPPAKAKRRLKEGRTPEEGTGLARVVDSAAARIRRLRIRQLNDKVGTSRDPLQRVQFEASDSWVRRLIEQVSIAEYVRRKAHPPTIQVSMKQYRGKLLQLGPATGKDR